jgi:hypothetical protein
MSKKPEKQNPHAQQQQQTRQLGDEAGQGQQKPRGDRLDTGIGRGTRDHGKNQGREGGRHG